MTFPEQSTREPTRPTPPAADQLRLVNPDPKYVKAKLTEPSRLGYIYLAAAVRPGPLVLPSAERTALLAQVKQLAQALEQAAVVVKANVFRAIAMPPTARFMPYAKQRGSSLLVANFDVIVLIQTTSPATIREAQGTQAYAELVAVLSKHGKALHTFTARNIRRIGEVDTASQGLFLFNHFAAADPAVILELWEYLAGWYAVETGLDNSVALAPLDASASDYTIVNWARWDSSAPRHFWRQLSKRSFRTYVLANLEAHQGVSMPIYCRLA
jgi:hypothetical protein